MWVQKAAFMAVGIWSDASNTNCAALAIAAPLFASNGLG